MNASPSDVTVRLNYLGTLRRHMGCRGEEFTVARPATVKAVLDKLVEIHGDGLSDLFYNQYGWLDPRLFFLVDEDGTLIRATAQSELAGTDGTEQVTLMLGMPMSGG
jgi:hypothetical protein